MRFKVINADTDEILGDFNTCHEAWNFKELKEKLSCEGFWVIAYYTNPRLYNSKKY